MTDTDTAYDTVCIQVSDTLNQIFKHDRRSELLDIMTYCSLLGSLHDQNQNFMTHFSYQLTSDELIKQNEVKSYSTDTV